MLNFFKRTFGIGASLAFEATERNPQRPNIHTGAPRAAFEDLPEQTHKQLVASARYCERNFGIAKEMVASTAIYTVGDGILAQARTSDEDFNRRATEFFLNWATNPDLSGMFSFRKLQEIACRAMDTDGEVFFLKYERGKGIPRLEVLESQQLSYFNESGFTDGILFRGYAPQYYKFEGQDPIEAKYIIPVRNVKRPTDVRCAPAIQHAIPHLLDFAHLLKMEKANVAASSGFALALSIAGAPATEDQFFGYGEKSKIEKYRIDSEKAKKGGKAPPPPPISEFNLNHGGKTLLLPEGGKMESFESKRPSPTFNGFLQALARDATLGILPYECAIDPNALNGPSIRLQISKMARIVSNRQMELIESFLNPVWRFVIGSAIKAGKLMPAPDWTNVDWICPRSITVDAGREAAQMREDVRAGLLPIEDYYAQLGHGKFVDEMRRRAELMKITREVAEASGVTPEQIAPCLFPK